MRRGSPGAALLVVVANAQKLSGHRNLSPDGVPESVNVDWEVSGWR